MSWEEQTTGMLFDLSQNKDSDAWTVVLVWIWAKESGSPIEEEANIVTVALKGVATSRRYWRRWFQTEQRSMSQWFNFGEIRSHNKRSSKVWFERNRKTMQVGYRKKDFEYWAQEKKRRI